MWRLEAPSVNSELTSVNGSAHFVGIPKELTRAIRSLPVRTLILLACVDSYGVLEDTSPLHDERLRVGVMLV